LSDVFFVALMNVIWLNVVSPNKVLRVREKYFGEGKNNFVSFILFATFPPLWKRKQTPNYFQQI